MINKTTISPSQSSHGGSLYYVYKIPKEEYNYKRIEKNSRYKFKFRDADALNS